MTWPVSQPCPAYTSATSPSLQGAAVMPVHALLRTWFDLLSPEQVVMAYGMTEGLGITALRGDEWLAHPASAVATATPKSGFWTSTASP